MKKLAQGFNTAAQDSKLGPLSRETDALPLSHGTHTTSKWPNISLNHCLTPNTGSIQWFTQLVCDWTKVWLSQWFRKNNNQLKKNHITKFTSAHNRNTTLKHLFWYLFYTAIESDILTQSYSRCGRHWRPLTWIANLAIIISLVHGSFQSPTYLCEELEVSGSLTGQQHHFLTQLKSKLVVPVLVNLQIDVMEIIIQHGLVETES